MCHEKYHVDPDLRAVANRLVGLHLAQGAEHRERCMSAARLLLAISTCDGLSAYVDDNPLNYPSEVRHQLRAKLLSTRARIQAEAYNVAYPESVLDEGPF